MIYSDCKGLTLEDDGVQVIPDILDPDEIAKLKEMTWNMLTSKTRHLSRPVCIEDPSTFKSFFELFPAHGMLLQHWDFGHGKPSWFVRQHPKVIDAFAKIWKTDDLLTSFDGISISLPCEVTGKGWHRGKDWLHTDQSFERNGFECVQGFLNAYDVNDGDATLRVLRGSHKLHGEFRERFDVEWKSDWCRLEEEEHRRFYADRSEDICVKAPAGSLVLWDSRTIHQGMEPQKWRERPNTRLVFYVCMTPASKSTQKNLENRMRYFERRRTCNHWPHASKLFDKTPRTYGRPVPNVHVDTDLEVTELMRRLVGYDYYKDEKKNAVKRKRGDQKISDKKIKTQSS